MTHSFLRYFSNDKEAGMHNIFVSVCFYLLFYTKIIVPHYLFFSLLTVFYTQCKVKNNPKITSKIELKIQFKAGREKIILPNQF